LKITRLFSKFFQAGQFVTGLHSGHFKSDLPFPTEDNLVVSTPLLAK